VLAWAILTIGFALGMPTLVTGADNLPGRRVSTEIVVADVNKGSAAEEAGLAQGDILVSARSGQDEIKFNSVATVGDFTRQHLGQKITLKYEVEDKFYEKEVTLSDNKDAPLGVALAEKAVVRVPWYKAPYVALHETWEVARVTFDFLVQFVKNLFSTGHVDEGVGGPVAVYVFSGVAIRAGIVAFMQFIAILSVNLALVNILPFPALDGGRLLFIILEKIKGGKVVREDVENIIHTIGFVILIALVIAITYRDIVKLF
jgi:regulator of sigma E protease